MNHPAVIPIRPIASASDGSSQADAASAQGCGACHSSAAGPVCRVELSAAPQQPRLEGPPDQIRLVMAALRAAMAPEPAPLPSPSAAPASPALSMDQLVAGLSLSEGEAVLTLAVAPRCAGAHLVDTAFHCLRRLLPDTDIYVRHAG